MNEKLARAALYDLRSVIRQAALYPPGHPAVQETAALAALSANTVARANGGEAIVALANDSFYLDRDLLAHTSLEFHRLLRELQGRSVQSVTFLAPVSTGDIVDLASFVAGRGSDLPAEGTVRLNEAIISISDEETGGFQGLRKAYSRSLDVLRGIGAVSGSDQEFDLSGAAWAVEQLMEQAFAEPAAALLLSNLKSHDEYTFYHCVNVCILSLALARKAGMPQEQMSLLGIGALLHDIGKVTVSPGTLQHPGRLDHQQWAEIKSHPLEGAEAIMAAANSFQEVAAVVAFEHHARFDQSGYPKVAQRAGLHFFSRLVATVDTYDAITTRRSYRRAETPNRALRVLSKGSGSLYDPDFVKAFIELVGVYPAGSLLQRNDGSVVMVTQNIEGAEHPEVVLVRSTAGEVLPTPEPASLAGYSIVDQLSADTVGVDPSALLEVAGFSEV